MTFDDKYEEWKKKQEEQSGSSSTSSFDSKYAEWQIKNNGEDIVKDISSRYETWMKNYKNFITNHNNRMASTGYKSDTEEWLSKTSQQKANFDAEAKNIQTLLDRYKDYLDADAYKSITESLSTASKGQADIINAYKSEHDFFSQFKDELDYDKYDSGWLDREYEVTAESAAKRKRVYDKVNNRIAELNKEIAKIEQEHSSTHFTSTGLPVYSWDSQDAKKQVEALQAEKEQLESEATMYRRWQGVVDSNYKAHADFDANAAYRDYDNISVNDLQGYAYPTGGVTSPEFYEIGRNGGYWGKDGNLYHADGTLAYKGEENFNFVLQDKLGAYLNTSESDYDKILYTLSGFENDDYAQEYALVRSDGKSKSWDYLTDTEIGIYYDLMKREGQASAYKFLDDMTTELNRRATEERSKRIQQLEGLELVFANAASIPMQLIGGATGFVSDVIDIVQGDEINPYSNAHAWSNDAQAIRGTTAEKIDAATGNASLLGISWGDMYQFSMSAADSLVGSAIGGTGYGVLMGMGAASSEMKELYERGASTGQMLMGGLLAGAAEMVFEKISIDHFVNLGDPKAMKDVIVNILKQGGVEASEELFTEIANTISDAAVMGSQSEFAQNVQKYMAEGATQGEATLKALKDVGFNVYKAAVGGFFSGAGMGAGGASVGFVGSQIDYANQGRDIIDNRGVAALQNLANEMTANKAGLNAKQIGKLSQKVSDGNTANKSAEDVGFFAARSVGKLSDKMGETLDAQGKADIQKALVEKGLSKKDANRISNNIQRQLKGEKLSESELAEINDNEKVKEALTNLDAKTDEMKLRLGLARIGIDTSKTEAPTKTEVNTVDGMDLHKEVNTEGKVSETEATTQISTGEAVTIDKSNPVAKTEGKGENLKIFYNTDKGVVEASDISYASETEALVYESFVDLGAAVANAAIKNYDGKMPVQEYVDGMRQGILMYGKYNFQGVGKDIFTESSFTALSETDQQFALKLGRAMSKSSATNADTAIRTAMSEAKAKMKAKGETATQKQGKVRFEEGTSATTKEQRVARRVGEILARATGRDVVFYDATQKVEGEWGYDSNGYTTPDGTIYLDLRNAKNEKQAILFTLSHELVHFAKKFAPVEFQEFADFLVKEYGKHGVDVDGLVHAKMSALKRSGDPQWNDYDYAFEEVIADACERFLVDSNAIEKLNALGEKTWVDKIINKIMEFIKNVRDAYAQFTGRYESQKVSEMTDVLDELYAKFESMVVGAAQTSQQMATLNIKPDFQAMQENASMSAIQGTQDGAATRTVYTATVAKNVKNQIKTEREAYPKMSMSVSGGASYVLRSIEGLTPTMIDGLVKGNKIAGFTGRQCREHAMVVSGFNAESVKAMNEFMDKMASFMEDAAVTYKFIGLNDVHNAKLHYNYNRDGSIKSIVLSAMVQNGDYPVNFDLTAICKKKEAMAKLLDKLSKRGSVDSGVADLTPSNIFKINKALKDAGYETACLGCFVESKRYNIKAWAEKFCAKWNAEVKKVNPNATYFDYGKSGVSVDDLTMEQVVKLDESVNKFTNESVTKRVQNALQKYKDKQAKGEPLFAKTPWSKAALERLEKSPTLSEALKDKYRTTPYEELTLDDVSVLLEHGILSGAALSNKQKIAQMVKSGEAYQHLLRPSDLITSDGISKLEELPNFHGVLYGHYGSGTPKLIQGFTPYNSEIALLPANKGDSTLAEYLYSIAGVRMQSFSDFQIQNVYDYLQMIGDLAARKLPAHAYTKEISFAKLFGMTGIKTNLSVMFDIDPSSDSEHAGLIKYNPLVHKGEYAKIVLEDDQGKWVYNIGDYATQRAFAEAYPDESKRFLQSIGFADAVKLQTTKGYSSNLGIIGVGYSNLGIVAMLNDRRIRYVIPYHKSGLPADVQVATNISLSRDYTSVQNNTKIVSITDANGNKVDWSIKEATKRLGSGQLAIIELADHIRNDGWKVETKKAQNGHGSFDLYGDLGVTNDPRETAKNYFDWCAKNNTLPVFFEFGWHDNYYKLLYDFNVYDCVTEKYAPQGAVTNTYPMQKGESIVPYDVTKGNFDSAYLESTIDKQMSFMNRYNETLDEDLDKLAENVEKGIYSIDPDAVWENKPKMKAIEINKGIKNQKKDSFDDLDDLLMDDDLLDELLGTGWISKLGYSISEAEVGNKPRYKGDTKKKGKVAKLTDQRINHLFWEYGSSDPKYAQAYITSIHPRDFLSLTLSDESFEKWDKAAENGTDDKLYPLDIEKLKKETQTPFLKIDSITGEVVGHEGRHRMRALLEAGVTSVPIAILDYNTKYSKQKEVSMRLTSQGFRNGAVNNGFNTEVENLIPINKVNESEIVSSYGGNGDIKFQKKDSTSYAPTFYSQMGKVIDGIKMEKIGASSVVPFLKGKGIRHDEIKWSGIEAFLEGKKSVTKAELQEFVAGSTLQIQEEQGYGRWRQYALEGGENYRELVFGMPDSEHSNSAMRVHWGRDAKGIVVHARMQDFETDNGKMLFIEEIQSDWHNEGREKGYTTKEYEDAVAVYDKLEEDYVNKRRAFNKYVRSGEFRSDPDDVSKKKFDWLRGKMDTAEKRMQDAERDVNALKEKGMGDTPDAPFRDNYHEYVLKRLIRMAAEEGYKSIGWTPAYIQEDRWSEDYAEGYRIEYDQDIPKFLKKYGKKWGATVGKDTITASTNVQEYGYEPVKVWSMPITESMEQAVLYEGQPKFQMKEPTNRTILANALESTIDTSTQAGQNELNTLKKYQENISKIEELDAHLAEVKAEIKELSFSKGKRDTARLNALNADKRQTESRINVYDKRLLELESTKPIKDVLAREKALVRKRAEQKGKEALAKYKEKSAATVQEIMKRNRESRKRMSEKKHEKKHKTELRHKIQRTVKDLSDLLVKPTKERNVKDYMRKAVADALLAVNMDTTDSEAKLAELEVKLANARTEHQITELTKSKEWNEQRGIDMSRKLAELRDAYEKIAKSKDPVEANEYDETVRNFISSMSDYLQDRADRRLDDLSEQIKNETKPLEKARLQARYDVLEKQGGFVPIGAMSTEELQAIYDTYTCVLNYVRHANSLFAENQQRTATQTAEAVNEEIRNVAGFTERRASILNAVRKFGWKAFTPTYALQTIGSDTLTSLYRNLRKGEDTWSVDMTEAKEYRVQLDNQYERNSWNFDKTYRFKSNTGNEFSLSLGEIMSLYAYSRRGEQALEHITKGGFMLDSDIKVKEKKKGIPVSYDVNTRKAYNVSKETIDDILATLTDEQRAYVEKMQDYLSTVMAEKGNEVSLILYGIRLFNESDYFPLKTANYFTNFDPKVEGEVKIKNSGFTKNTVRNASNPIVLSDFGSVWGNHVHDMAMYHAFLLGLEDFTRVFNYHTKSASNLETMSTQSTLASAYDDGVVDYIKQLLVDINGGARGSVGTEFSDKMVSLMKKGAVAGSLSVAIQQPSAFMRAMAYIEPKYFVATIGKSMNFAKHNKDWDEVKKYAPVAIIKEMGRFDTGVSQGSVDWLMSPEYEGLREKAFAYLKDSEYRKNATDDILGVLPSLMDELTWVSLWQATKKKVSKENGLDINSEECLNEAGEFFTNMVSHTQVYDSTFSRSGFMRSKDTSVKMATSFMAEPTVQLNMLFDAIVNAKRGGKKGLKFAAKTAGVLVATTIFNNALKAIVYAGRDDDEEKTYIEKYFGHFVGGALDEINPLSLIPYIKDIVSLFQGYDVERTDMALFSDAVKAIQDLSKDGKSTYEKTMGAVSSLAAFFGLPVKNIERDVRGVWNTVTGFFDDKRTSVEGIKNSIYENLPWGEKVSKSDSIYKAIVDGDQAYLDRLKSEYKDDKSWETALRTALKENDPRIMEAAIASIGGDPSERVRIQKTIIAEGNFTQDDVVAATNSLVSSFNSAVSKASSAKARGDMEEYNDTIDDLIEKGYSEELISKHIGKKVEEIENAEPEVDKESSIYSTSDIGDAYSSGDDKLALEIINDLVRVKTANSDKKTQKEREKEAKSSVRTSVTKYWKPLYKEAYKNKDQEEMKRIRFLLRDTGLYGTASDILDTCKGWLKEKDE